MSRLQPAINVVGPKHQDNLGARLRQLWEQLAKIINGNIEFGSPLGGSINIDGVWNSATTPGVANTDFTVIHNLGRTVVNFAPATKSAACDVYLSPTANGSPSTQIILRATTTGVALTFFFY
jgi:hypothetical protein